MNDHTNPLACAYVAGQPNPHGDAADAPGFNYDQHFESMIEKKKKDNSYRYFNAVNR